MKDRVHRDLSEEDVDEIAETYHNWRNQPSLREGTSKQSNENNYQNIKGFCKSATLEEIEKHGYVLTPGRYVGITDAEDDGIPFEEKMQTLTATLKQQMDKEAELNSEIEKQLAKIGFVL